MANTKPIPLPQLRASPRRRIASIDKTLVGAAPPPPAGEPHVASLKKTLVGPAPSIERPNETPASAKKTMVGGFGLPPSRRFASGQKTWVGGPLPGERPATVPIDHVVVPPQDARTSTVDRGPLPDAFAATAFPDDPDAAWPEPKPTATFVDEQHSIRPLPPTAARYRRVAYMVMAAMALVLVVAAASAAVRAHARRDVVTIAPPTPTAPPISTTTAAPAEPAPASPPATSASEAASPPSTAPEAGGTSAPPASPRRSATASRSRVSTRARTGSASSPTYGAAATPVLAPFDRSAAASALARASNDSVLCKRTGAVEATRVRVTFAPDGSVQSARALDGSSIGACVAENVRKQRVPPFKGEPMTITTVIAP